MFVSAELFSTRQDVDNQWEQEMWGRTSWRAANEYSLDKKEQHFLTKRGKIIFMRDTVPVSAPNQAITNEANKAILQKQKP